MGMAMKRREFLSGVVAGLMVVTPASAQDDYASGIVDQLRRQGFQSVLQERTLLGRVRITATRSDGRREIIINPRTGEILRDLWMPGIGGTAGPEIIEDGYDRPDDDDGEYDEYDDDEDYDDSEDADDSDDPEADDGDDNSGSSDGGDDAE